MYNGIGLATVRGSATSGHVSKNMSYIKPEFFRNKLDANQSGGRQGDRSNGGATFKVNKDVLEHNRKHALEAQVFEFEDSLREKGGYTEEEIESKVADFRANQAQRQVINSSRNNVNSSRTGRATDTHEISARKIEENERLRSAFGIGKDFVSGASFDPVVQEQRRKDREAQKAARFEQNKLDRERREQEQAERRKIQDGRREADEDRRGEKRGRDDSRERRRDSRDRDGRYRGGRSDYRGRDRSRDRSRSRSRSGGRRRVGDVSSDRRRGQEPAKLSAISHVSGDANIVDTPDEEGEIRSPARQEEKGGRTGRSRSRSNSPAPVSRRSRSRSASRDSRSRGRGRSPVTRKSSKRRARSPSSASSSSSSSSSSSDSGSSSSDSSSNSSRSRDKNVKRGAKSSRRSRSN